MQTSNLKLTRYVSRAPQIAIALSLLMLSGCAIVPQLASQSEVKQRVKDDVANMYTHQEPIQGAITLEEAVARTLKYNLDYRLKQMESALALGMTDLSQFDLWPKLLTNAGYNARSNYSGGTSIGIEDNQVSLRPSTSQERGFGQAGAEFSWNVLDFGVSYYQAKQNADQFLIAEERRRKIVQNMLQDVRAAYWRALGAQRLAQQGEVVLKRAESALKRSREAEEQKIISPALALNYQRALLDATSALNQRRQDLEFAKRELAALMSVPPGQDFNLAESKETVLPPVPQNILELEEMALLQRPELREEDYKKRITAAEARKQLFSFLPNFNITGGTQYNSNEFLYNKNWQQASVGITWNLLKVFSLPTLKKTQAQRENVDQARRMALSMAILTQLRVSTERYKLAVQDYDLADKGADVDQRLANFYKASMDSKLENELEAIRTEARAVLGAYQKANAYANAQIAFGRLYNTLGFDPLEDNYSKSTISELSNRIKTHITQTQTSALAFESHLFNQPETVHVKIEGVNNPEQVSKMKSQVIQLLARNNIQHQEQAQPLVFKLDQKNHLSIDKTQWRIQMQDAQGKPVELSSYETKIPSGSRASVLESSLLAAATFKLNEVKALITKHNAKPEKAK